MNKDKDPFLSVLHRDIDIKLSEKDIEEKEIRDKLEKKVESSNDVNSVITMFVSIIIVVIVFAWVYVMKDGFMHSVVNPLATKEMKSFFSKLSNASKYSDLNFQENLKKDQAMNETLKYLKENKDQMSENEKKIFNLLKEKLDK